jgi:ribosomal protein RSM22 (predicted rRNA methylase)
VTSLLDLGAGPGAATLAARQIFSLSQCTLIESDPDFVEVARQLLPEAELLPRDLRRFDEYPAHDLVVANCALSELSDADRSAVVDRAWRAARVALVILEPGSPAGFALIRTLRDRLLGQGAHMIAPCPAEGPCPMVAPDWCHFGQRVERTSLHRRMKRAELGYEDEKFSYVALAKAEVPRAAARILRRPEQRPGMIELVLCHGDQIRKERVTRRTPDAFRAARHALWGGEW